MLEALESRVFLSASTPMGGVIVHLGEGKDATGSHTPLAKGPPGLASTQTVVDRSLGGTILENAGPVYSISDAALAAAVKSAKALNVVRPSHLVISDPAPGGSGHTAVGGSTGSPKPTPGGLHIVLEEGPHLKANPQAAAAFRAAADYVESFFSNPVTLVVDAEIAPMGAGVIGQTSSTQYHFDSSSYEEIRNLLASHGSPGTLVSRLPTGPQFRVVMPDDSYTLGGLTATRADLLALGMSASSLSAAPTSAYAPGVRRDMSLTFGSSYPFDYNRADGISPGKIDFEGAVIHELTHGLGFISEVDKVDAEVSDPSLDRTVYPTTLDLFRLRPGAGATDFTNSPRILAPGSTEPNQVLYDGGSFDPSAIHSPGVAGLKRGDIPLSTGFTRGDGREAAHWKDTSGPKSPGVYIGVMEPAASPGEQANYTAADLHALGLIGWRLVPGAIPSPTPTPAPTPTPTPTPTPPRTSGSLPSPWKDRDIGKVGRSGGASFAKGVITNRGAGADVNGSADGLHYVYQSLSGDGQIVARVTDVADTDAFAKAGVMVRQDLSSKAANAFLCVTRSRGVEFSTRAASGAATTFSNADDSADKWLRLVRSGNVFTAFTSADGAHWNVIASRTVPMTGSVLVGLAVTSHNQATVNTSTLDNVRVTSGAPKWVAPPQVALSAVADTYTWDGKPRTNFGSAPDLKVAKGQPGFTRRSYLTFDLAGIRSISSAVLRLYGEEAAGASPGRLGVYAAPASWGESGLTWSERPAASGTPLATTTVTGHAPRSYTLDLTRFLRAQKAAGVSRVNLVLDSPIHDGSLLTFHSRDASSNGPQVIVTP